MKRSLSWIIDNLDFLAVVLVSAAMMLLAATGWLQQGQLPEATLSLLITLAFFLAIRNYRLGNSINRFQTTLSDVRSRLAGSSTRLLVGSEDFYATLNRVISKSSKLEVTYFSPAPPGQLSGVEVEKYWKTLARYLRRSNGFRVRRIVTIESEAKLQWVRHSLTECDMSPDYHLAVVATEKTFPLLNVVTVDNRYSIVFEPHSRTSDYPYILIDDERTAEAFHQYFERVWAQATKIKIGNQFSEETIELIAKQLKETRPIGASAANSG